MDELYNLIAEMITYLVSITDREFFKRYNSRTLPEREQNTIRANVQELFEEETEYFCELNNKKVKERKLLEKVKILFLNCKDQGDCRCLLRLLEILDSAFCLLYTSPSPRDA